MRIALFHNVPSGGAKRAVYEWVRRLTHNQTIDVYSLSTADHCYCDIRPLTNAHFVYSFESRKLFKSPWGRINQYQRWRDLADLDRLHCLIATDINIQKYDVVFSNTCRFTFIPAFIQYCTIPVVHYLHEPYGPGFVRKIKHSNTEISPWRKFLDRYDPLIRLYQKKITAIQDQSTAKAALLLSNSQFTSEFIQDYYKKKAELCTIGVDVSYLKPLPEIKKESFVLSVGELSPRKGFDFVIESLRLIPLEKRPILKLACNTIDLKEKEYILNLAQSSGVKLDILTNQNIDQLRTLYNQARLCVYAPYMEPFGLVPLESMACGTPVVGIKEGGVQESIIDKQTGLLIERDPHKFCEGISWLLFDPELAKIYGQNGRNHVVSHWTWEQSTANLEHYLEQYAI